MRHALLLELSSRGIPGVISFLCRSLKGNEWYSEGLALIINHTRATGRVQIVVWSVDGVKQAEDMREALTLVEDKLRLMALEGEVFTVNDPIPLDQKAFRVDITRTMREVKKTGPPPMIEDLGEIDEERQKVLVMSIEDFAGELMKIENVKRRERFSRVFDSVRTWRDLTHVWHLCEYGLPNLQDLEDQYRRQFESTVSEALAVYGFRLRMSFRSEYRAQFMAVTGDRIPFDVR